MGPLARAADAFWRPELAHGALAAAVVVLAGRRLWPSVAGPVAVVAGLAWVAVVTSPVADGRAMVALAVAAVVAVAFAGAAPAARAVPAAGAVGVIVAVGVVTVVPDTERALALLGAVTVSAVAVRHLDRRWLATLAAAVAWVAVVDGAPRGSAVAGALGCAALPALLAAGVGPPILPRRSWWAAAAAVVLLATAVCARVAGLRSSTPEAVAIVAVVVDVELVVFVLARRRRPAVPRAQPLSHPPRLFQEHVVSDERDEAAIASGQRIDSSVATISVVSRYRSRPAGSCGSNGWKPRRSHQDRARPVSAFTTTARHAARSLSSTAVASTWATSAVPMPSCGVPLPVLSRVPPKPVVEIRRP